MLITAAQLRAARGLLDWTRTDLAKAAGISPETIKNIEHGTFRPQEETTNSIVRAFGLRSVKFTEDGVRFTPNSVEVFEGPDGFDDFYEFIYEYLSEKGGDVCIGSSDARLYAKYRKDPELHRERMRELVRKGNVKFRILAVEGDQHLTAASYAEYRWQPEGSFAPSSFYAFGECLALVSFKHEPAPYVVLIKSGPFAEAYRQAFNIMWQGAKVPVMPVNKE